MTTRGEAYQARGKDFFLRALAGPMGEAFAVTLADESTATVVGIVTEMDSGAIERFGSGDGYIERLTVQMSADSSAEWDGVSLGGIATPSRDISMTYDGNTFQIDSWEPKDTQANSWEIHLLNEEPVNRSGEGAVRV